MRHAIAAPWTAQPLRPWQAAGAGAAGNCAARPIIVSQLFALIYLQKFMLLIVSVPFLYLLASLAWMVVKGHARISPSRSCLYLAMAGACFLTQTVVPSFSVLSLLYLLLTYFAVICVFPGMGADDHRHLLKRFSDMMLVPAVLVLVQYAYEVHYGLGHSLSLDPFVPRPFLLPGFMAESSTSFWVTWNRPNGIVFLEPSFCSAFLACALLIELNHARRLIRIGLFAVALVATNGGTGWTILAIGLPVTGLMRAPLATVMACLAGILVLALADSLPAGLPLLSRLQEFGNTGSSGYGRLVLPLVALVALASDPVNLLVGHGAGAITLEYGSAWPITKMLFEYGGLATLLYLALFCTVMAGRHTLPLRVSLFVVFQFTGGYLLNPLMVMLLYILFSTYTPSRQRSTTPRSLTVAQPAN